jgi:hypothetical protein
MCIVSLDGNKTVFHEVHIKLRVARSTVQLMFVLGAETEHLRNEVRSAFILSLRGSFQKASVSWGTGLPALSVNRGHEWRSTQQINTVTARRRDTMDLWGVFEINKTSGPSDQPTSNLLLT